MYTLWPSRIHCISVRVVQYWEIYKLFLLTKWKKKTTHNHTNRFGMIKPYPENCENTQVLKRQNPQIIKKCLNDKG